MLIIFDVSFNFTESSLKCSKHEVSQEVYEVKLFKCIYYVFIVLLYFNLYILNVFVYLIILLNGMYIVRLCKCSSII